MARFLVYANADPASRKRVPCLLDVQSDLIEELGSRVVVPLIAAGRVESAVDRLMPQLLVRGEPMVMDTAHLAGVSRRVIGEPLEDLSHEHDTILAALEFLVSGI